MPLVLLVCQEYLDTCARLDASETLEGVGIPPRSTGNGRASVKDADRISPVTKRLHAWIDRCAQKGSAVHSRPESGVDLCQTSCSRAAKGVANNCRYSRRQMGQCLRVSF